MLEIKPLYTVAELAEEAGQSQRAMAGMLRARGVQITRGHRLFVTLADLQQHWPALIESLQIASTARGWSDVG